MHNNTWCVKNPDADTVTRLMLETGYSRALVLMLISRGLDTKEKIDRFLHVNWLPWSTLSQISSFDSAIERIRIAVEHKEKILIYGDRDVDGITATVILVKTLQDLGADVEWYVTGEEGYGLNEEILKKYIRSVKLIITVDCGITACAEAGMIREAGIDLIITDHHEPSNELPQAYAIINPKLSACEDLQDVAGCGISFIIAIGLMLTYSRYYYQRLEAVVKTNEVWDTAHIEKCRLLPGTDSRQPNFSPEHYYLVNNKCEKEGLQKYVPHINDNHIIINETINGISAQARALDWIEKELHNDSRMSHYIQQMLCFVVLGTVADMVPLTGINRFFVSTGISEFSASLNPGLFTMISQCIGEKKGFTPTPLQKTTAVKPWMNAGILLAKREIDKATSVKVWGFTTDISAHMLAWKCIPLLNAAGRCGKAGIAVQFFLAETVSQARGFLHDLNALNDERKDVLDVNMKHFEKILLKEFDPATDRIIILSAQDIAHGVTGIIANRLLRMWQRPVALIIKQGDQIIGTIRSKSSFDCIQALDECKDLLVKYGGHKQAAGFTVASAQLDGFKQRLKNIAQQTLKQEDETPAVTADGEISLEWLDEAFMNELQLFEPFGTGWGYPLFCVKQVAIKKIDAFGLSGRHIKMKIDDGHAVLETIGWDMADRMNELHSRTTWDMMLNIEMHSYNAKTSLRLQVIDYKPAEIPVPV